MKKFLVGYTGFVGSNLYTQTNFDAVFNSKNIEDSFYQNPDLLVYAGIPAKKFLANQNEHQDLEIINNAIENIKKINPKKIVLISTIDVYNNPFNVDELTKINNTNNHAYGKNRYILEEWVMNNFDDYLIVRLPGLYGRNLKKNFIYDLINIIPSSLKEEKYLELYNKDSLIKDYYLKQENNFYNLKNINNQEKETLKEYFKNIGFSALNFTDSRSIYQFYNLSYLWEHINIALNNNIKVLNLATEPITSYELYKYLTNEEFINEITTEIPNYNYKTIYDKLFNGKDGYIFDKEFILKDIKGFIEQELGFKLSISNIAWENEFDEEIYKYLSLSNFKGLEIAPTKIIKDNPYDNLDKIKNFALYLKQKYNLEISSIQSIWYGKNENLFNSKEEYQKLINYTKKAIDFASVINCNNLVFGCPRNRNINPNIKREEAVAMFKKFLKEIGEYAKEKKTIFSIEANPVIYNTNFINTTKEAIEIVKELNLPNIKINLDLGTIIYNEEELNFIASNIEYINHIHISEPYLEKIKPRSIHQKLLEILKNKKYNKFISIEMKTSDKKTVKETIDYVKEVFK